MKKPSSIFIFIHCGFVIGGFLIGTSLAQEASCQLEDSRQPAVCVRYQTCGFIKNLADPLPIDTYEEIRRRLRSCSHIASNQICCESEHRPFVQSTPPRTQVTTADTPVSSPGSELVNKEFCGISNTQKVAYGNLTRLLEYPWMALLQYENRGQLNFQCGGTVISEYYVLTAAHCVVLKSGTKLKSVRLGEHDLNQAEDCEYDSDDYDSEELCADPVQDIPVAYSVAHPDYNKGGFATNDIAVVRLSRPADFTKNNVKPICLPLTNELQTLPNKVVVTGFGVTETSKKSNVLLQANLPIFGLNDCRNKFSRQRNFVLTEKQFCAGGEGRTDSCKGDSGGPVQYPGSLHRQSKMIQYGIVSFGVKSCGQLEGFPGVYTRISAYNDWILANITP